MGHGVESLRNVISLRRTKATLDILVYNSYMKKGKKEGDTERTGVCRAACMLFEIGRETTQKEWWTKEKDNSQSRGLVQKVS